MDVSVLVVVVLNNALLLTVLITEYSADSHIPARRAEGLISVLDTALAI